MENLASFYARSLAFGVIMGTLKESGATFRILRVRVTHVLSHCLGITTRCWALLRKPWIPAREPVPPAAPRGPQCLLGVSSSLLPARGAPLHPEGPDQHFDTRRPHGAQIAGEDTVHSQDEESSVHHLRLGDRPRRGGGGRSLALEVHREQVHHVGDGVWLFRDLCQRLSLV